MLCLRSENFMRVWFSKLRKPGRSRVEDSPHRKLGLSSDAKVILALLRRQPQRRDELLKSAHISLQTWYRVFPTLERFKILKETERGYALSTYVDREEDVVETIKRWKDVAFRFPDLTEIADATGISPQDAEAFARKTIDKTGWFMPNQAVREGAREKLCETLVLAARMKDGKVSNFDYEDATDIMKEAERFLKEHPEMLPKLDEDGEFVAWSPEALKYLGESCTPKDRTKRFLAVIR